MDPLAAVGFALCFVPFTIQTVIIVSNATVIPGNLMLLEGSTENVYVTAEVDPASAVDHLEVFARSDNPGIARVAPKNSRKTDDAGVASGAWINGTIAVRGVFLGRTFLQMFVGNSTSGDDGHRLRILDSFRVAVIRQPKAIDRVFVGTVAAFVIACNIGFGCKIHLDVLKSLVRRPVPLLVGFGCQCLINPLIAYALIRILSLEGALAFGLFAFGSSPSGGGSNAWTLLLDGDLDLSLTMTFISTLTSLGIMPLWLFTLGRTLIDSSISIPYLNIMISLVSLILPCAVGLLVGHFLPKAGRFLSTLIKPFSAFFVIFVMTFGIYAKLYMFEFIRKPPVLISGLVMPWCTFLTGAFFSRLCRLPWKQVKTIAIETEVQNTGVAIVTMLATLPNPDGDIAAILPVAGTIFTPLPLVLVAVGIAIRKKCFSPKPETADGGSVAATGNSVELSAP